MTTQTINNETVENVTAADTTGARIKFSKQQDAALYAAMLSDAKGFEKYSERFAAFLPTLQLLLTKASNKAQAYSPESDRARSSMFWSHYHDHIKQVDVHNAAIDAAKQQARTVKAAEKQAQALAEKLGAAFAPAASAAEPAATGKHIKYGQAYLCIKTMLDALQMLHLVGACKTPEQLAQGIEAARAAYMLNAPKVKAPTKKVERTEHEKVQALLDRLGTCASNHVLDKAQFTQLEDIYHTLKAQFN